MKSRTWMYAGASLLLLAFGAGAGKPITSLILGCQNDQYFDPVDKACVKGGRLDSIAGRSQEEVQQIADRWGAKLADYKGVTALGIDRHGIRIEVDPDHARDIPKEVEGIPVNQIPTQIRQGASHTATEKVRPYTPGLLTSNTEAQIQQPMATGTRGPISK